MHVSRGVFIEISRAYGSLSHKVLSLLKVPSKRHYLRVNTLLIEPGELLDILRERYPGFKFGHDPFIHDAIFIEVKGPFNVPVVDKKVVVDWRAAESIILGANVYAPGVIDYSEFRLGDEVNIATPSGEVIGLGRAMVSSEKAGSMKHGVVVETIVSRYRLPRINEMREYRSGLFHPQSLPAIIVGHIMDPKPGDTILDCCAAPGGKASHLIQLSRGRARVIAVDRSKPKINKLIETINRLRLPRNIHVILADSRYLHKDYPSLKPNKLLIDPPCSALGFRPKLYLGRSYRDIVNNVMYQRQFINMASGVLEERGIMVYSTCTLTFSENEGIALSTIEKGFESIDIEVPYANKVYIDNVVAYRFDPLTRDLNGFFIAVFKKKG